MSELARMIGACPSPFDYLFTDFPLFLKLAFGPDLPYAYRLKGPHPSPEARQNIMGCENRRIKATRKRETGFSSACGCSKWPKLVIAGILVAILIKVAFF
jgi:hypothetical protein